eukprot:931953-Amphidinium_carterae.1
MAAYEFAYNFACALQRATTMDVSGQHAIDLIKTEVNRLEHISRFNHPCYPQAHSLAKPYGWDVTLHIAERILRVAVKTSESHVWERDSLGLISQEWTIGFPSKKGAETSWLRVYMWHSLPQHRAIIGEDYF